ncbi:ROK family protein [Dictyobacter aurantiacus]|uniref:ROK family protein n=1 Tax=Dictyobacter aurantiacus TaxID=1936993 RepID=A0A401ZT30_9CHLR|nr:ROK family protein [Dictyobacter aurantiacus]GCE10021.1 hypothetical protein KDAU_73500 [Dictyobacter aurantiacus]
MAGEAGSVRGNVLAFDVGGTRMKAGIVQSDTIVAGQTVPLNEEDQARDALTRIEQISQSLLAHHDISALGLSIRGIVDPQSGIILDVNGILSELIHVPLGERLSHKLGCPVFTEYNGGGKLDRSMRYNSRKETSIRKEENHGKFTEKVQQ